MELRLSVQPAQSDAKEKAELHFVLPVLVSGCRVASINRVSYVDISAR